MGSAQEIIRNLLIFAPPFVFSLCFHEYAHAWAANRLGDSTAKYMGRLTLDPLAHISWMGTVFFPALVIITGAPVFFGWAKPVPVDMRNLRNPRQGMALVAAAGPLSNIFLAIVFTALWALLLKGGFLSPGSNLAAPAHDMLRMAVILNLFLAVFNLLPIPPLDGSRIVQGFVSHQAAETLDRVAPQAQMLLLILLFTGMLRVLATPVYLGFGILVRLFGIPY